MKPKADIASWQRFRSKHAFCHGGTNYSLNVIGHKLDLLRDNKTRENAMGQLKQFMAVTFVLSVLVILFNLLADVVYGWLDPRISYR